MRIALGRVVVTLLIALAAAAVLPLGETVLAAPADLPPPSATEAGANALVGGNPAQAITSYTEALKDAALPNDRRASILNDRGIAYIKLGQPRQAIEDFNQAAQLFPEYAAVYNNRGNLLLSLGLLKEATKDFDRAIVLAPGYAAAYNNRAGVLVRQGKLEEAIRDYTKAIKLVPTSPAPLSGRGRAHLALLRPHAAIRDFSRAVNADARFAAGYRNRAEAKLEVEHYDEAIEDLSRAIAFDISNAEIYVLRGKAYLATKNIPSAIKDFSQATELDPKLAAAFAARGLAHGLAQAYEEAYADLNKAIELDPRSSVAFAYRAFVYKQNAQLDIGLRDIETAVKLDAERPEVYWAKAELEEAQGQADVAIADLRKALVLRPGFRDATESLQRLGAISADVEDKELQSAGLEAWRVVLRGQRYFALNDQFPRLSVPLEMMGEGEPRILEWQLKEPPFKGIGVLRFFGGTSSGSNGAPESIELAAVLDLDEGKVVAIEPDRQGDKVATWTWEEGKVTVASTDGATDEFMLRAGRGVADANSRRYTSTEGAPAGWAPWSEPWAGGFGAPVGGGPVKRSSGKKKSKTLFDMLFN